MRVCSQCGESYSGAEIFCSKDGARIIDPGTGGRFTHRTSVPPPPAPDEDPFIGKLIQRRYRVIRKLGEGGMGVVYVAEHVEIEKRVALKVLRDDFSNKPDVVERFRQEARAASKIGNPHIVDVTDFGQLKEGGVYFAMELLEGQGLSEVCNGTPLALDRAAPIIDQIARALQAAHDKGIVHRDLKPENIFLVCRDDNPEFVKILDFGIAKISDRDSEGKRLTQTGMIFGTPEYMSPEQAAGKPLDHRVDVYALGCIMFELFTGQVPYRGDSFMAILTQHMFEPIPSIRELVPDTDVPDSVLAVVYRAMAKETNERYKDMTELREDLIRALADTSYIPSHPGRDQTMSFGKQQRKHMTTEPLPLVQTKKKSRGGLIAVVVVLLAVAAVAGGIFTGLIGKKAPVEPVASPVEPIVRPVVTPEPVAADTGLLTPPVVAVDKVTVTLSSTPAGAVMEVQGMGQVCSKAPCEVEVDAGKPILVTARIGSVSKDLTITPSQQNRDVSIQLDIPKSTSGTSRTKKATPKEPAAERPASKKTSSGLKIPDVFKDR